MTSARFKDRRIVEIYLELANVTSPGLVCAALDFFCNGYSASAAARKYDIDRSNLRRVRKAVNDVADKIELVNRLKCGLDER